MVFNVPSGSVRVRCGHEGCSGVSEVTCSDSAGIVDCATCGRPFIFLNCCRFACECGKDVILPVNTRQSSQACGNCGRTVVFRRGESDLSTPLEPVAFENQYSYMICRLQVFQDSPEEAFVGEHFFDLLRSYEPDAARRKSILLRAVDLLVSEVPVSSIPSVHGYCNFKYSPGDDFNAKVSGTLCIFLEPWLYGELLKHLPFLDIWVCGQDLYRRLSNRRGLEKYRSRFRPIPAPLERALDLAALEINEEMKRQGWSDE